MTRYDRSPDGLLRWWWSAAERGVSSSWRKVLFDCSKLIFVFLRRLPSHTESKIRRQIEETGFVFLLHSLVWEGEKRTRDVFTGGQFYLIFIAPLTGADCFVVFLCRLSFGCCFYESDCRVLLHRHRFLFDLEVDDFFELGSIGYLFLNDIWKLNETCFSEFWTLD